MAGTLDGVTVVALEQAVAAPFCTSRLADAGARVIKVERAEGDFARRYDRGAAGQSAYFVWLNRGKESVALDFKTDEGRRLLEAMLVRADVFIQNLAPGAVARAGFGAEALGRLNPRLVQVNISGYGPDGPFRDRKAYDLLIQADSGLAAVTGGPDGPARVGVSICDIATGMYAHAAILEALIDRGCTGQGAVLDVAMFDAMADWMAVPLLQAEGAGRNPDRLGMHHASISPYGAYPCADGAEIVIAVQNEREWLAFCTHILGDPGLAEDPRFADMIGRVRNRPALSAIVEAAFARAARDEVAALCASVGIAHAFVRTPLDLAVHPHLRRVDVASPGGPIRTPAAPAIRRGQGAPAYGAVPGLDEHGPAIRREFTALADRLSAGRG